MTATRAPTRRAPAGIADTLRRASITVALVTIGLLAAFATINGHAWWVGNNPPAAAWWIAGLIAAGTAATALTGAAAWAADRVPRRRR